MAFGDITQLIDSVYEAKEKKKAERKAERVNQKEKELEERNKFNLKLEAMSPTDLTKEFDLPF